jgi:Tfp pilus assembly protein PilN
VKRVDYLRPTVRRVRLRLTSIDGRLRHTLAALGIAVFAISTTAAVETARLADLRRSGVALTQQLARADAVAADARTMRRDLARLRGIALRVAATRRSGPAGANEVASLGNRLPPDVWLTSLRIAPGEIALEGRGARLEAVAAAMRALARSPHVVEARLVNVHDDAVHGGFAYALALDRRP